MTKKLLDDGSLNYTPTDLKIGDLVYIPQKREPVNPDLRVGSGTVVLRMPLVRSGHRTIPVWAGTYDGIEGKEMCMKIQFPYDVCFLVVDLSEKFFTIMHNKQKYTIKHRIYNSGTLIRKTA